MGTVSTHGQHTSIAEHSRAFYLQVSLNDEENTQVPCVVTCWREHSGPHVAGVKYKSGALRSLHVL